VYARVAVRHRIRSRLESLLPEAGNADGVKPGGFAVALRRAFRSGYDGKALRADLLAGLVVGIVAVPLSMALANAVGASPQNGLYTAIIAGGIAALAGGSKFQITGPTAAFVVILEPIVAKHGLRGLLLAGLMAGFMLIGMGVAKLGRLIQFIPYPVTTGFTAGIAWVIASLQLKDALGLRLPRVDHPPESYVEKMRFFWEHRGTAQLADVAVAAATVALLLLVPKLTKRIPAPLIVVTVVSLAAFAAERLVPGLHVSKVPAIPRMPPTPMLPWEGQPLTFAAVQSLVPSAFAIAMLGAIESLLSAVIADGMTGKRHDPNGELIGQGLANVAAPFFGGIAATGALARTATNVRSGARSPIAGLVHAGVVLAAVLLLAPLVAYVPMAALAGLLLVVAYNMSEVRHFAHVIKVAPKSDVIVLVTCFLLTVLFDMVVAVGVGVVLAALLFMRRMAELTETRNVLDQGLTETARDVPKGVALYEIAGPLFFGAAQNAMSAFRTVHKDSRVIVLDLSRVPAIDATGLVALEGTLADLVRTDHKVILAGPLPKPRRVFDRAELSEAYLADDLAAAMELARKLASLGPDEPAPPSRRSIATPVAAVTKGAPRTKDGG